MKGLELSERYYREYGAPMIAEKFPGLEGRVAVGLAGEGSECLGYDDEVSRDHDFGPSFCMWLTEEDFEKYSFPLSRAYSSLPASFEGFTVTNASPTGGARRGVLSTDGFYTRFLGSPSAPKTYRHWLSIPEHALCAATSGKVFRDDLGEFSAVRCELMRGYPEDVRLKKLASALILAAQSGVYNYPRCLAHGESGAAQLSIFTFVKNILAAVYLINNKYMPFYKWAFRGLTSLPTLSDLGDVLAFLIETGNGDAESAAKRGVIEDVSSMIKKELLAQRLISSGGAELELASYEINDRIKDPDLRNENIFAGMIRE